MTLTGHAVNRASWIFCAATLAITLAVCAWGFSLAALPPEQAELLRRPVPAEQLSAIDIGGGFGSVLPLELLGFYLENPPAAPEAQAGAPPPRRRGGC